MAIPGVGSVLAAVFVAEIGDVSRFESAEAPVQLGRAHAHPSRVRREGPSRSHHQTGFSPRPLGRRRGGGPPARRHHRHRPLTTTGWPSAGATRSAAWLRHANFSPSSTTGSVTARSVAWPRRPSETRNGRNPLRARRFSWSPHCGGTEDLIEPSGLRPQPPHVAVRTKR